MNSTTSLQETILLHFFRKIDLLSWCSPYFLVCLLSSITQITRGQKMIFNIENWGNKKGEEDEVDFHSQELLVSLARERFMILIMCYILMNARHMPISYLWLIFLIFLEALVIIFIETSIQEIDVNFLLDICHKSTSCTNCTHNERNL